MNSSVGNVIPMHSGHEAAIRTGTVISVISGDIRIHMTGDIITAKKAFSCLIDPEPDDVIVCTENENGMVYILGIIERPATQKMRVSFPSDTQIQVNQGGLHINSTDHVTLASKEVNCFSTRIIHKSREAIVRYDHITAGGNELQASFKTVRLISHLINTIANQVIDKFKGYIRSTEDSDMVKAGQMTRRADGLYAVDSKHTIMNSKKSTKIDGEKILMG